ncbi:hypothetical protein JW711_02990 [Candidatus Woesearchaeota archaeon]|nr:hypothetical protein [Candidatus Woesearchaeota archaeon]
MTVVGLTGTFAAGKGTCSEYLQGKGFIVYSLSDIIREELRKEGVEIGRTSLQDKANYLRRTGGPGVLAERTLRKLEDGKDYVIDSIRNPAEIEVLRRRADFFLIVVDAPIRRRYDWAVKRMREGEGTMTFEEFKAKEERELYSADPTSQQLVACRNMADVKIINDSDYEALYKKVDQALAKYAGRTR